MTTKQTLLVTGASGQLGRRVLELLLQAGHSAIIAATRTPEKLADFAAQGVVVHAADFDDEASLVSAFTGADRMLLISTDAIGRRLPQQRGAIAAAAKAGVKHVLYTSWVEPNIALPKVMADHHGTERALIESGLDYTLLRNNLYTDGLLASLPSAIASGQLFTSAGDGAIAYVTREDCARAAASALASTQGGHNAYAITGPEALTQTQVAQIASEITGKTITAINLPPEQLKVGMVGAGLPEFVADLLLEFDLAAKQGLAANVSKDVEKLTGRAGMSVRAFLQANLKR